MNPLDNTNSTGAPGSATPASLDLSGLLARWQAWSSRDTWTTAIERAPGERQRRRGGTDDRMA